MLQILSLWFFIFLSPPASPPAAPPPARRVPFEETFHGVTLTDPYHWLEDFDSPEAADFISAQDEFARAALARAPGQEFLRKRLSELTRTDNLGVPTVAGGRYFYTRTRADADLPVVCVRKGFDGPEEVLLDPAALSPDRSANAILSDVSRDGKLAAYLVRQSGQDEVEVRVKDVDTRQDLPDRLPKALYERVSILPDRSGFYYARRSRSEGPRVFLHRMGADPSADEEIFGKGLKPSVFVSADVSSDGRWLIVNAQEGWAKGEVWYSDLRRKLPLRSLTEGFPDQFRPRMAGPNLLALETTWKAPRGRVLLVNLESPTREEWREIVPEGPDAISNFAVIGGRVFVSYLHDVRLKVEMFGLDGKRLGEVALSGPVSGGISGEWDHDEGFLSYQSFTSPGETWAYRPATGEKRLWFARKVPLEKEAFEVRQEWFASKDGTRVPMYLVHKKGLKLDGKRPTLLTGYGGFNVSQMPGFSALAILWAELGGVWARPNLRGGSEFGEEWHRAGMLAKKQNVFDDFLAAAEWLIGHKATNPSLLAISGTSNGGLLVGAALTQRPDLFSAVYCGYPDLDMVRYFRYTKNNNAPALLEYGDASKADEFPFLRSWSPYERVTEGTKYPAVLLATGAGDTRVPPQQAVKMAAKLQWATRSGLPVLLRFDRKSGHAGGRTQSQFLADLAAEQAFLLQQLGVSLPKS
ncbi:MAG TPA: prolyl oligopeptidase family serine peptidase [Thermoanaerobaculia bacterium]|nr:prolyl oligopeptidase family serine peptidase [Thermoanaerobaculia bacterium]